MNYENSGYSYQDGAVFRKGTPLSAMEEFAALDDLIRFLLETVGLTVDEVVRLLKRSLGLSTTVIRNRVGLVMDQLEAEAEAERDQETTPPEPEGPSPW